MIGIYRCLRVGRFDDGVKVPCLLLSSPNCPINRHYAKLEELGRQLREVATEDTNTLDELEIPVFDLPELSD